MTVESTTTTSTTSVQSALAGVLEVTSPQVKAESVHYDDHVMLIWTVRSKAARPIKAFQVSFVVAVTDSLGRNYAVNFQKDCSAAALRPGEFRVGKAVSWMTSEGLDALTNDEGSCTGESWTMNEYIENEGGLYAALDAGVVPTVVVQVNRITFDDGSGIGTAVGGA
jgi:hypothetical protein